MAVSHCLTDCISDVISSEKWNMQCRVRRGRYCSRQVSIVDKFDRCFVLFLYVLCSLGLVYSCGGSVDPYSIIIPESFYWSNQNQLCFILAIITLTVVPVLV